LLRREETLADEIQYWTDRLFADGYAIIPGAADPALLRQLDRDFGPAWERTPFSRGNFFGTRTIRFARLLVRSQLMAHLVQHELIQGIAERALRPWCESIQLNLTQAIAVHPGAPEQLPHRDQDMWDGPKGELEYMVNVIWPLTPFTAENGATVLWSGSNRREKDAYLANTEKVAAEMPVGSALLFLGSTLHAQGANVSSEVRKAAVVGYSLSWLKAYENQILAYPPHVARKFNPELADLVGYRQIPPNLNNFEAQSPTILLRDEVPEFPGAVDAFRPDQIEAIDYYLAHGRPRPVE
ncbi:MAG TPA: phytanoyl-CoA dioxygenase family protein, partial [Allosphingosinicella sp.]|nr:phytanoyl-CoA dioxygenase family protein [Allosphingosinicella sp.]